MTLINSIRYLRMFELFGHRSRFPDYTIRKEDR